jgi:hypothetical protein
VDGAPRTGGWRGYLALTMVMSGTQQTPAECGQMTADLGWMGTTGNRR